MQSSVQSSTAVAELPEVVAKAPLAVKEVTVLFGSQTGNGEGIAENVVEKLKAKDYNVTLSLMSDYKPNALKKTEHLLIVVSTHGEGDPPDTALTFHEFLYSRRAPKLEGLHYSVLALGDSSYELFCHTGKEFDERLAELGASRLTERVDCDLDFDEPAAEWFEAVLAELEKRTSATIAPTDVISSEQVESTSAYSRTNPFYAEVFENLNLNGRGSNKETRHIELSLEGSGLRYEPGDSLGIYPENDAELVSKLLQETGWNSEEQIVIAKDGTTVTLKQALTNHFEITVLTKPLLEKLAELSKNDELQQLLQNQDALRAYVYGRDLLDAWQDFGPWDATAQQFTAQLRKIPARLYSIASSLEANPEEVHLTIGVVKYEAHGRERSGVCSVHVAEHAESGTKLPVYVHKNTNFRLPADDETPIIMIGPGTGIAPFRAFLEQREATGAQGKSWLFFGDQHYVTDFLYQIEWQRWLKEGVLTNMDVAFSRDTDQKVYVQHRMQERRQELYRWLQEGAVLYVCGDEQYMAKDVHATLVDILQTEGGYQAEEAENYLTELIREKRYQRDVY